MLLLPQLSHVLRDHLIEGHRVTRLMCCHICNLSLHKRHSQSTFINVIERAAYPLEEAARLLGGIHRGTLYNMRDRGEIRFVKIGRRSLIPADEIRRLTERPDDERPPV
jgi:excisionase family DNA binding protein